MQRWTSVLGSDCSRRVDGIDVRERLLTGEELVENHGGGVDIHGGAVEFVSENLRRHVSITARFAGQNERFLRSRRVWNLVSHG